MIRLAMKIDKTSSPTVEEDGSRPVSTGEVVFAPHASGAACRDGTRAVSKPWVKMAV